MTFAQWETGNRDICCVHSSEGVRWRPPGPQLFGHQLFGFRQPAPGSRGCNR